MTKLNTVGILVGCGLMTCLVSTYAQGPNGLIAGGRYHADHSVFTDLPYADGDVSYLVGYEYTQDVAIWQLGVDFAPDVTGTRDSTSTNAVPADVSTNKFDFAITPQANLLIKDRMFIGGVGLLYSYIRSDDGEGEWLNPYFQLMLGLRVPITRSISINGSAFYVMERWDKITEFKGSDLDYGGWLSYAF